MKIIIVFPKKFFTTEQLKKLTKYDCEFIEDKSVDFDKVNSLYSTKEFILAVDPTYLKEGWDALPMSRIIKMKGLKALCLSTTSFSWVDVKQLGKMGIIVTNAPGKSTNAVAEFNIYMMMSLLRKIPLIIKNNLEMDYDNFINREIKGLTAGIIGLGQIGSRVAELCQGLGMKVCYWNRSPRKVKFKKQTLPNLVKNSDVVFTTIATPPEVRNLITDDMIKSMKDTTIMVSTSGPIYNQDLVLKQVANNKLGGFAFESETEKLTSFKGNVIVFPEQAYFTDGTLSNTAKIVTDSILSVIKGKPINKVN